MSRPDVSMLRCLRPLPGSPEPWENVHGYVRAVVARKLGSRAHPLAEEAVSLALASIFERRAQFRGTTEPAARLWIRTVARNAALTECRREGLRALRFPYVEDASPGFDPPDPGGAEPLARRDALIRLDRTFRGREHLRDCWLLAEDPARPLDDGGIARRLGYTVSTVRHYRRRARRLLATNPPGKEGLR